MRAMIFDGPGRPLRLATVATPSPGPGQVLLHVHACGICRTDLHIVDGELKEPKLPLILGHQIVGTIVATGERVERFLAGERVGVPWLGFPPATIVATASRAGRTFAIRLNSQATSAVEGSPSIPWRDQRFVFPVLPGFPDLQAGPLALAQG